MKKFAASLLTFALCAAAIVPAAACAPQEELPDLKVFAPDGAPALALVNAIAQEEKKERSGDESGFDFKIVDANKIESYVTGDAPEADICIMPLNTAAKLLGNGETYQMLGTVTNGNLYFLTTGANPELKATEEDLSSVLLGKKMGVVQLSKVPGLTLQVVLNQYGIPYQILESAEAEGAADKVNLIAFTPENVTPAGGCDYYLCPEPAAGAKIKGTSSSAKPFKAAGDLQTLYGAEEGYPQAVAVVKKSAIESRKNDVAQFISYLRNSESFLADAEVVTVLRHLAENREEGLNPSFNEKNLTKEAIAHCSVKFHEAKDHKEAVVSFLTKLIEVNATAAAMPDDSFFYMG